MPNIPQRQSLLGQTVTSIRQAIQNGDWKEALPPERRLCEQLNISRSTLRRALKKIEDEGLIDSGKSGTRRKILISIPPSSASLPTHTQQESPKQIKKLLWITRKPLSDLPSITVKLIALLQSKLGNQGCLVEVTHLTERAILNPDRHIAQWLAEYSADVFFLHWMPANVQHWFQQQKLPVCILGTPADSIDIPSVEVDSLPALRHAIGKLQRLGHRHIVLIRQAENMVGEEKIEEAFRSEAEGQILTTIIRCPDDPDSLPSAFDKHFGVSQKSPATAAICTLPHLALFTLTHLQKLGFSIPAQLSILVLRSQPMLDFICPKLAHYSLNEERAISETLPRVLDLLHHQATSSTHISLTPEFVDGDSLAPPLSSPPSTKYTPSP